MKAVLSFVANDGKIFNSLEECVTYEKSILKEEKSMPRMFDREGREVTDPDCAAVVAFKADEQVKCFCEMCDNMDINHKGIYCDEYCVPNEETIFYWDEISDQYRFLETDFIKVLANVVLN